MKRHSYSASIVDFIHDSTNEIFGILNNDGFATEPTQKEAWHQQILLLKEILPNLQGTLYFEYAIPRMGRRIDVVLIIDHIVFLLEFKVGEKVFHKHHLEQVYDYALDLKNFHETSHELIVAPILVATEARDQLSWAIGATIHNDKILSPLCTNANELLFLINEVLKYQEGDKIDTINWALGRYSPTPTIIEAAMALYNGHDVEEISRNDAEAINLKITSTTVSEIVFKAKELGEKVICFVTGVPGAGKTLVGLDIATKHFDKESGFTSVFLSGNEPLVSILREALTRDKFVREKAKGKKVRKGEIFSNVKVFIQNVHHFRDECLIDESRPPFDHVAIFDEAQRAWNVEQQSSFMKRKKGRSDFNISEPEFLISCLDRHQDWAAIICLVGGGQEINTGESGISEWIASLNRSFPDWKIYVSNKLTDNEYAAGHALDSIRHHEYVYFKEELHLAVSMRSFRAEHLSTLVKNLLDLELDQARKSYNLIRNKYPIKLTRDLNKGKSWLKQMARGTERYGLIVSSQAQRLKPLAIDVRTKIDPVQWFLNEKDDVRSSFYLEDAATEFQVQGLELDWACVTWDGDFRYTTNEWQTFSFVGNKWNNINKLERKNYLKNAYRVLLTRARQGMVIVVPEGSEEDPTRKKEYYDSTYNYLKSIGLEDV